MGLFLKYNCGLPVLNKDSVEHSILEDESIKCFCIYQKIKNLLRRTGQRCNSNERAKDTHEALQRLVLQPETQHF